MQKKELYEKTVNILVQAYFDGTLQHENCCACAVGNMVAANGNIKFYERSLHGREFMFWKEDKMPSWSAVFETGNGIQRVYPESYRGDAKKEIDSTGYTWQELAEIENAFEMASYGNSEEDWMFNGLMKVIETLDKIHHNTDTSITTTSKGRFNKELVTP